jgi:hypothetical protein
MRKYRGDASIEIDSLDQNRLQLIEKIQNPVLTPVC